MRFELFMDSDIQFYTNKNEYNPIKSLKDERMYVYSREGGPILAQLVEHSTVVVFDDGMLSVYRMVAGSIPANRIMFLPL